jgi:hypothetical protein
MEVPKEWERKERAVSALGAQPQGSQGATPGHKPGAAEARPARRV